ncbi:MAG TPA: ribosome maturation factor RimM [Vitreimonas sp.]|nr:ribosome maturation factor RimM [Vitreimonas sp.]
MPDKKNTASKAAPAKAAAKAAPAKKVAAAPRRGEPVAKKAAPPPKPVKAAKAPPAKAAPVAKAPPPAKVAKAEKAPAAAKGAVKSAPPPKPEKKSEPAKAKADPKAAAKTAAKAAPPTKVNGKDPAPAKTAAKAAKPEPVKAEKPAKPAKPAKPEKPPKPVKLAPVEAAFAKPKPAKPLAVAAGRAEPVSRVLATPAPKAAPKPLVAPKPAPEPELVGDLQAVPAFKAKAPDKKGMVLVGAIAGAFGVKGEVRLRAFTEKKDGVIAYGPLYDESGKVLLKPKNWRELKDGVAVAAPEVKSREQAEKMKGQKLFVPRSNLPATAEDEFYVVDLLGSKAEALDGTVLGDIVAVWNFGAGDIIEYRPPNGGPNVRVTFTKETVPHVDLAAKRVVIDPPAPEPVGK